MLKYLENVARQQVVKNLATLVGLGGIAVFTLAAVLNPYTPNGQPRILGTHEQLGLPPCNFRTLTGHPCPGCGMTTCFSLLAHGDFPAAWTINWAGVIAAGGVAFLTMEGLVLMATSSNSPKVLERHVEVVALIIFGVAFVRWLFVILTTVPWPVGAD
jgi:hypothetical protein